MPLKFSLFSKITENNDETIIKPPKGLININLREIWQYRELLLTFTWRDIKVKYKQTALGVMWAIIPPLLYMLAFSLIFGRFIEVQSDIPYPIFVFTGILIWNYIPH